MSGPLWIPDPNRANNFNQKIAPISLLNDTKCSSQKEFIAYILGKCLIIVNSHDYASSLFSLYSLKIRMSTTNVVVG